MKAIAIDLDGTLLNSKHEVSDFSKHILRKLSGDGVKIILASARPIQSVINIARNIGLPDSPMIGGNGAIIANNKDNIFYKKSIEKNEIVTLFEMLKSHPLRAQLTVHIYSDFAWFIPFLTPKAQEEINIIGFPPTQIGESVFDFISSAQKIMIVGSPHILAEFKQFVESNLSHVSCVFSKADSLEMNTLGVSKYTGVAAYAQLFDFSISEVIAFGDGDNDEHMLRNCGIGVAMENATILAKKAAAYLTKSNNEDGVALFLQSFFKIK